MSDSSRIEINGGDYFGHQKKKLQIADRRPVIRKAADLVGPGINANTVQITSYNDLLATYNGFFSSEAGASFAPNETDQFAGFTISDAALGGTQTFTSLATGVSYRRTFTRSPLDAGSIFWGDWTDPGEVEDRVAALEAINIDPRLDALEARAQVRPLRTGVVLFWGTSLTPGSIISGVVSFPIPFSSVPAAWAIRSGFVTGGGQMVVGAVDMVTADDCRIVLLNAGDLTVTFEDLPIRWFAQTPN
jgi:hypothetical protein